MKKTNKKNKKIKNTIKKIQKKGSGYHPLHLLEYSQLKDIDKAIMYFDNNCDSLNISNLNIPNKEISELKCNNYELELLKPLGQGSFNKTMLVKDKNENKYCLRITYKDIDTTTEKNELDGLYLQSYLSLPEDKGGVGCKYICGCYGFGKYILRSNIIPNNIGLESREGVYGILEYVKGGDLFKLMNNKYKSRSYFSEIEVSQIIGRLLIAVNCIHQHHFVHLDIKPENILCNNQDNRDIKLIDFGMIKYINPTVKILDPRIHGTPGTPGYASPEIITGNLYDFKSDIWSVGITMLNLLLLDNNFHKYMYDKKAKISYVDIYKILGRLKQYNFSKNCINLLKNMLNVSRPDRFNALQCLQHPWISNYLPNKKCYGKIKGIDRNMIKKICDDFQNADDYAAKIKSLQQNINRNAGELQNCSLDELTNRYIQSCNK